MEVLEKAGHAMAGHDLLGLAIQTGQDLLTRRLALFGRNEARPHAGLCPRHDFMLPRSQKACNRRETSGVVQDGRIAVSRFHAKLLSVVLGLAPRLEGRGGGPERVMRLTRAA